MSCASNKRRLTVWMIRLLLPKSELVPLRFPGPADNHPRVNLTVDSRASLAQVSSFPSSVDAFGLIDC